MESWQALAAASGCSTSKLYHTYYTYGTLDFSACTLNSAYLLCKSGPSRFVSACQLVVSVLYNWLIRPTLPPYRALSAVRIVSEKAAHMTWLETQRPLCGWFLWSSINDKRSAFRRRVKTSKCDGLYVEKGRQR